MNKILKNELILNYQKDSCLYLKRDLYDIWCYYQSFDLKGLYSQWLIIAYLEDMIVPRVRQSPNPCDLQLYDEVTDNHVCCRIGILS